MMALPLLSFCPSEAGQQKKPPPPSPPPCHSANVEVTVSSNSSSSSSSSSSAKAKLGLLPHFSYFWLPFSSRHTHLLRKRGEEEKLLCWSLSNPPSFLLIAQSCEPLSRDPPSPTQRTRKREISPFLFLPLLPLLAMPVTPKRVSKLAFAEGAETRGKTFANTKYISTQNRVFRGVTGQKRKSGSVGIGESYENLAPLLPFLRFGMLG